MTERQTYAGFHLHHALACLRAGYPENAVSWMWRDYGEIAGDGDYPDAATLQVERQPDGAYGGMRDVITFLPVRVTHQGLDGEGI